MEKSKVPGLITILIMTLITSVMWVGFSIYRSLTTKPAPNVPAPISQPLTPSLDSATIEKMNSRIYFEIGSVPEPSIGPTSSPTPEATLKPTVSPSPVASASATPISEPTPTP